MYPDSLESHKRVSVTGRTPRVVRYLWYFHINLAFIPPPQAAPSNHTVEPPTSAWTTIHTTAMIPNVYEMHKCTQHTRDKWRTLTPCQVVKCGAS